MKSAFSLLLALLLCPCLRAAEERALTDAGTWLSGDIAIAAGAATIGKDALPLSKLVAAIFPRDGVNAVDQAVVLQNGDVLVGMAQDLQSDQLNFIADRFGALKVPAAQVRGLLLTPRRLPLPLGDADFAGVQLQNSDRVNGTVQWINEANVGVHNGRRIVEVPRARASLACLAAKAPEQRAPHCVRLCNGDRISGEIVALDAQQLKMKSPLLGEVAIARTAVVAIWNSSWTRLSELKPASARQVPQFREEFPISHDVFRSGDYLSVGGSRYEHGLGCHAGCELEYDVDGSAALVADLGIDDAAGARGEAAITFSGDGKMIMSCDLRPGMTKAVAVPLAGVKRLKIQVLSGRDDSTAGDSVDLGWAVLLK